MAAHHLHWPHGQATVLTTAAMLANCMFALPNAPFSLFARASWMSQVHDPTMIGHLRELGGDFACLPFGIGRPAPGAFPEWSAVISGPTQGPIHDPAADADWGVVAANDMAITLALVYPDTSPVLRVERTLTARPTRRPWIAPSASLHDSRPRSRRACTRSCASRVGQGACISAPILPLDLFIPATEARNFSASMPSPAPTSR